MNLKRSAILRTNNLPAFKSTYVGTKGKSEIFYFHFDLAGFSRLVAGISSTGPAHIHKHMNIFMKHL